MKVGVFLKTINSIFIALLMGQIAVYYFIKGFSYEEVLAFNFEKINILHFGITFGAMVLSYFLFHVSLKKIANNEGLRSKLTKYQTAMLIKLSILEFAFFFLLFATDSNANNALYLIILLVFFFLQRPTKNKIASDLKLSLEEEAILNKDEDYLV